MPTTVYFATNRVVNGPPEAPASYTSEMISPTRLEDATYGTAFVDNSNLTADTVGAINSLQDIRKGGFSQGALDDLAAGGRNLLVFLHGFANSFENAITRGLQSRMVGRIQGRGRGHLHHCLHLAVARRGHHAAISHIQLSPGSDLGR